MKHFHYRMPDLHVMEHDHAGSGRYHEHHSYRRYGKTRESLKKHEAALKEMVRRYFSPRNPTPHQDVVYRRRLLAEMDKRIREGKMPSHLRTGAMYLTTRELEAALAKYKNPKSERQNNSSSIRSGDLRRISKDDLVSFMVRYHVPLTGLQAKGQAPNKTSVIESILAWAAKDSANTRKLREWLLSANPVLESIGAGLITGVGLGAGLAAGQAAVKKVLRNPPLSLFTAGTTFKYHGRRGKVLSGRRGWGRDVLIPVEVGGLRGTLPGNVKVSAEHRRLAAKVERFNRWIKEIAKQKRARNPELPLFVITMGLPGSGKSTIARRMYAGKPRVHILDTDLIASRLPGYDPKDPEKTHKPAQALAEAELQQRLQSPKGILLFESTGTNTPKIRKYLKWAQDSGWRTRLMYVTVSLDTALARNRARERVLPDSVIREKSENIQSAYLALEAYVDEVKVIDND